MSLVQLPKHGSNPVGDNWEPPHILRAPYQSIMFPRNDKVDVAETILEAEEESIKVLDHLRHVPMATNVASSFSLGGGVYGNRNLKQKKGGMKGMMPKDVFFNPPGGVQWIHEGKLSEEYGSLARLRRPDTEVYGGIDMPGNMNQIDHPIPKLNADKLLVPVTPSAVYNLDLTPQFGSPDRMMVIKPSTSLINSSAGYGQDFAETDTTRYIHEKDMISYLTPTFSPFLKIGDSVVPVNLRDPLTIALQAQAHLPIDLPLPDGTIHKIRDYTWTIVQASAVSPVQFILEVPVHLRDKPDLKVHSAPIPTAQYKMEGEMAIPVLKETRDRVSVMAPIALQNYQMMGERADPSLREGSHHYSALNTGYSIRPGAGQLEPTQVRLGPGKVFAQPEPISSYPWV